VPGRADVAASNQAGIHPGDIATDGTNVYWANGYEDASPGYVYDIVACAVTGCGNNPQILVSNQSVGVVVTSAACPVVIWWGGSLGASIQFVPK
jgi:hypothetical protein